MNCPGSSLSLGQRAAPNRPGFNAASSRQRVYGVPPPLRTEGIHRVCAQREARLAFENVSGEAADNSQKSDDPICTAGAVIAYRSNATKTNEGERDGGVVSSRNDIRFLCMPVIQREVRIMFQVTLPLRSPGCNPGGRVQSYALGALLPVLLTGKHDLGQSAPQPI